MKAWLKAIGCVFGGATVIVGLAAIYIVSPIAWFSVMMFGMLGGLTYATKIFFEMKGD